MRLDYPPVRQFISSCTDWQRLRSEKYFGSEKILWDYSTPLFSTTLKAPQWAILSWEDWRHGQRLYYSQPASCLDHNAPEKHALPAWHGTSDAIIELQGQWKKSLNNWFYSPLSSRIISSSPFPPCHIPAEKHWYFLNCRITLCTLLYYCKFANEY